MFLFFAIFILFFLCIRIVWPRYQIEDAEMAVERGKLKFLYKFLTFRNKNLKI